MNYGVPNLLTMDLKPFDTGQRTRWRGGLRAGAVDARPAHAAGRAPLRPRVELLPRSADRAGAVPAGGLHAAGAGRREGLSTTSRRAAARPTIVFGNGKTSLKFNVGKYLEAATNHNTYSLTNPAARIAGSPVLGAPPPVTRSWTDANSNYVPDCDLLDPNQNDRRPSGGDLCGADEQRQLRQADLQRQLRSDAARRLGRAAERLADWHLGAAAVDDRRRQSRLATSGDGCRTSRSSTTWQ